MSDKGKAEAIRILRKEVRYGCPICRSPFLTFHHFDPPRKDLKDEAPWDPKGIIALCRPHHDVADEHGQYAGSFTKAKLREMKRRDYSSKPVKGDFWQLNENKNVLVRIGGSYTSPTSSILSVNHVPQIGLTVNEDGYLSLSFVLRNKADEVVAKMEENSFTAYPTNLDDMTITAETRDVRIWMDKEDIGLAFSFRYLTREQLEQFLREDKKRADQKQEVVQRRLGENKEYQEQQRMMEAFRQSWLAEMEPEEREFILKAEEARPSLPPGVDLPKEVREVIEEGHRTGDMAGAGVRQWVTDNCMGDDGLIPFLNFAEMAINYHGRRCLTVKNGIGNFMWYEACFGGGGMVNAPCHCPACTGAARGGE